jgi:hypothetical protein
MLLVGWTEKQYARDDEPIIFCTNQDIDNEVYYVCIEFRNLKANFHSGKLSVDWNGQENFSLSCELWVGTNDFNTKKNFLVRSNPQIIFLSGN